MPPTAAPLANSVAMRAPLLGRWFPRPLGDGLCQDRHDIEIGDHNAGPLDIEALVVVRVDRDVEPSLELVEILTDRLADQVKVEPDDELRHQGGRHYLAAGTESRAVLRQE